MGYKDIINGLKPIDYSKYKNITSYEKLMLYVARILQLKNVPLTFNYLCIATFKVFPDAFCCDEEFKEFPSVDRLNRTLMHLKYVQQGRPFLTGTTKNGYNLTSLGKSIAEEVESIINNTKLNRSIKAPAVDSYKKGFSKDYISFVKSNGYKEFLKTGEIDLMFIWQFYNVTPYTRIKNVKENLNDILSYTKQQKNSKCVEYIEKILKMI